MLETRLVTITRALTAVRGRRGLVQLVGGLALGSTLPREMAASDVAAAKKRERQRQRAEQREVRQERRRRKRGRTGPAGPTGPSGPDGTQGSAGSPGPAGDTGQGGPEGPAGGQGSAGGQGPQGAAGATGATGPAGMGSCPSGKVFVGAVGCVDTAVRGRGSFATAIDACQNDERLLTSAELLALITNTTVFIDPIDPLGE